MTGATLSASNGNLGSEEMRTETEHLWVVLHITSSVKAAIYYQTGSREDLQNLTQIN